MVQLDFLLIPLLYLPGFLAFKMYEYLLRSSRKYSVYEITMYALGFSTIALAVTLVLLKKITLDLNLTHFESISFTISDVLFFYGIALFAGVLLGALRHSLELWFGWRTRDCWTDFFSKISNEPATLQVITADGLEYAGWLDFAGVRYDRREISLTGAQQIFRDKNHKYKTAMHPVDRIIFTANDISRVSLMPPRRNV